MTANRRIFYNTLASYLRSVAGLFLGLWTSRWVLAALGEEDFGIYQMSGVCIVFFSFFSKVISGSVSRFYAFGLGKGGKEPAIWFANAFYVHLAIAIVFLPVAIWMGEWLFRHYFDIPQERIPQAIFAFRTSIIATACSILAAPFLAMFLAKQEIVFQSIGVFAMNVAQFIAAFFLLKSDSDKLMFYATTFAAIHVTYPVGMSVLALARFPECRHFSDVRKARLKELLSFSLWNALGPASDMIKVQGISVAVNKLLGVRRNAAVGIARRLSSQSNALSQSLMTALLPEIATSAGSNNESRVRKLASGSSILATLLSALLAIPISIEMDYILIFWLKKPPEGAGVLAVCILMAILISKSACGQGLVLNAKGMIREYQLTVAPLVASSVLIAVAGLTWSKNIIWVGIASLFSETCIAATGLYWGSKQADLSFREWRRATLQPILSFIIPACLVAGLLHCWLPLADGFIRTCLVGTITDIVMLVAAWRFALPDEIKNRTLEKASRLFRFKTLIRQ